MFVVPVFLAVAALTVAQAQGIETAVRQGMQERHIPSVVVRVDRDGAPIYVHAWGSRNVANGSSASPSTRYQYGSITKQFTAAAILRLASQGKLSLDDPLGKWDPNFAKFGATIRQALVHVTGIPDFTSTHEYALKIGPLPFVGADWGLAWSASHPADFAPGTQAKYDNAAYVLLARIIEKASGKSYEHYLTDEFLTPLGMSSAHGYQMLAIEPNTARGYLYWTDEFGKMIGDGTQPIEPNTLIESVPWNLRQVDGAGFLVGDAADLQRWDNALLAGKILQGKWRDEFYRSGVMADGTPAYTGSDNKMKNRATYCYGGLAHFSLDGVEMYGANGGTFGFLAFTGTIPSKQMSVTILTNEGGIDMSKLTTPILDALVK
jgi:D-alanyl-D-alanine carboxypeptidase